MIVTQGSSEVAEPLLQRGLDPQHFEQVLMFDRFDDAIEVCEERILERARARLQQRGTGSDDDSFLDAVFADVMNALDMQEEFEHLYFILGGLVALERVDPTEACSRRGRWGAGISWGSSVRCSTTESRSRRIETREGCPDAGQFLARLGRSSRCPLGLTVP
jgi:hypothetical protein